MLLTTQYLEEADRLADRLAVIDHGRLIAEGTSRELKASVGGRALHLKLADVRQRQPAEALLHQVLGEVHGGHEADELAAKVTRDELVPQALAQLAAAGIGIAEFALAQPSLDDVFMALTGKPVDSAEPAEQGK